MFLIIHLSLFQPAAAEALVAILIVIVPFPFIISVYVRLYKTKTCNMRHKFDASNNQFHTTFGIRTLGKVSSIKHCAACGAPRYTRLNSVSIDELSHCKTCNSPNELIQDAANTRLAILVRRETRAAIMTGATFISCLVFSLPLISLYWANIIANNVMSPKHMNLGFWFYYCNSASNPIIYLFTNPDFRRALHNTLGCSRPSHQMKIDVM
jgi:hypothetical protein